MHTSIDNINWSRHEVSSSFGAHLRKQLLERLFDDLIEMLRELPGQLQKIANFAPIVLVGFIVSVIQFKLVKLRV